MFKKRKVEEWNPWEISETENSETFNEPVQKGKKIFSLKRKNSKSLEDEMWDSSEDINYLDENENHVYEKEEFHYSKPKIFGISLCVFLLLICGIGYMNTDFDEVNKGYIVSYDLHYEREYVNHSDELYEYCLELKETLAQIMPQLANNSLSLTNEVASMKETLIAKTNKVSRYTEVPEIMTTYNDNLISFALSTQQMLTTMLSNYTNSDYMAWAESAYNDFCTSLGTLEYLRSQINTVIYRNVYGGDNNE